MFCYLLAGSLLLILGIRYCVFGALRILVMWGAGKNHEVEQLSSGSLFAFCYLRNTRAIQRMLTGRRFSWVLTDSGSRW